MEEQLSPGCERPSGGPVVEAETASEVTASTAVKEVRKMIMVGQKAPDFVAPGYLNGQFSNYKLSDHYGDGKWALLCFYPGDFTFV